MSDLEQRLQLFEAQVNERLASLENYPQESTKWDNTSIGERLPKIWNLRQFVGLFRTFHKAATLKKLAHYPKQILW